MFRWRKSALPITITIAKDALDSIFDDCDKFDVDETGGRLLGTYRRDVSHLEIYVKGVLEAGPNAERTPTYFLQDGAHQEKLFRAIEAIHPEIEHLGNWHTHHVNGYPTLSGGDHATYLRTVNHEKHNTDFFYALLVVSRNRRGKPRYEIKHFIFLRNDNAVHEVPSRNVRIIEAPALRAVSPDTVSRRDSPSAVSQQSAPNPERAKDKEFFSDFYPDMKALFSQSAAAPYWKGRLTLVDGSQADVVAIESDDGGKPSYSIVTSWKQPGIEDAMAQYKERRFRSARHALVHLERDLNQAIYRSKKG